MNELIHLIDSTSAMTISHLIIIAILVVVLAYLHSHGSKLKRIVMEFNGKDKDSK